MQMIWMQMQAGWAKDPMETNQTAVLEVGLR